MTAHTAPVPNTNRETMAWMVIWVSFGAFLLVCMAGLLSLNWYREHATRSLEGRLGAVVGGNVFKQSDIKPEWVVVGAETDSVLRENDSIQTDRNGRALITLFDGSTIQLLPDSEVQLTQLRQATFTGGNAISIQMKRGKAIVGVARPVEGSTDFFVNLPQGRAALSEGSYAILKGDDISQVKVREQGTAFVTGANRTVTLSAREASDLGAGPNGGPSDKHPASTDLIQNGDFTKQLASWQVIEDPSCAERTPAKAKIEPYTLEGVPGARFVREGSRQTPCEITLRQDLNVDVSEFLTLKLNVDIAILRQSLDGGGSLGSEYPLKVRINYRTNDGTDQSILRGFYIEPPRTPNYVAVDSVRLNPAEWKVSLIDNDLMTRAPLPRQILSVELVAGGHDYESLVRKVSLVGE